MVEGEHEVSWEMILKLSMIFIVSLQWHSQIMTWSNCKNNAGCPFSSGNNYSVLSFSAYHQPTLPSPRRQWAVVDWGRGHTQKSFRFSPVFKDHTKEAYSDQKMALGMEL